MASKLAPFSMSRRPTRRLNGKMMYRATVNVAVGTDLIAAVIYDGWIQYEHPAKPKEINRKLVIKELASFLRLHGTPSPGLWDEATPGQSARAYSLAEELFPELMV